MNGMTTPESFAHESSAAIFSMTGSVPDRVLIEVIDDVEPVPPAPTPAPVVPPRLPPPPLSMTSIPQSALDSVAVDLAADHPGTRWYLCLRPERAEVWLAVDVMDRLTNEVVGRANGTVSLRPMYAGKQVDIASEAVRMMDSIPTPL